MFKLYMALSYFSQKVNFGEVDLTNYTAKTFVDHHTDLISV